MPVGTSTSSGLKGTGTFGASPLFAQDFGPHLLLSWIPAFAETTTLDVCLRIVDLTIPRPRDRSGHFLFSRLDIQGHDPQKKFNGSKVQGSRHQPSRPYAPSGSKVQGSTLRFKVQGLRPFNSSKSSTARFPFTFCGFPQGQKDSFTLFGLKVVAVEAQKQCPVHCDRVLFRDGSFDQGPRGCVHRAPHLKALLSRPFHDHCAELALHPGGGIFHRFTSR